MCLLIRGSTYSIVLHARVVGASNNTFSTNVPVLTVLSFHLRMF
jgi:hypothetical protein